MKIHKNICIVFLLIISAVTSRAQDVSINIIPEQNGVVDGSWPLDAPAGTTTLLINVCNNDGGATAVPSYKLRPLISVPGAIVQVAPDSLQTGLPAGWTVLSNTGSSIRLSNGTDQIPAGECRDIILYIQPIVQGGPLIVTSTMSFSNGIAPGSTVGPMTPGNDPANDNSTSAITVTAPLPVTLASFRARKEASTARLSWSTTEETNSDYFEIQRSDNARTWISLGIVSSHGESNVRQDYGFTDDRPLKGANYYRLRMVDKDLSYAFSSIQNLDFEQGIAPVVLFPNPTATQLTVQTDDIKSVKSIEIVAANGQLVLRFTPDHSVFDGSINISSLNPGIYLVRLMREDGSMSSAKIVKQ